MFFEKVFTTDNACLLAHWNLFLGINAGTRPNLIYNTQPALRDKCATLSSKQLQIVHLLASLKLLKTKLRKLGFLYFGQQCQNPKRSRSFNLEVSIIRKPISTFKGFTKWLIMRFKVSDICHL